MRKALLLFLTFSSFALFGQVTSYPYAEGWETSISWTQSTADNLNWTQDANGTPSGSTGPSTANEGTFYAYVETSGSSAGNTAIIEQDFNLSTLTNPLFTFDYHMYFNGSASGGTLKVDVSTDGGTTWCNLWSKSGDQGNMWHDNEPVPLDGYGFGTVKLRFHFTTGTNTTFQNDAAIDDLNLTDAASATSCQVPICFSSSNVQATSVDFSWTGVSSASSGYNVIYGASGFDPKTAGTTQAAASASTTISSLSPGTAYDVYLYSSCGASSSDTTGPVSVTTALLCQTPTSLTASNLTPTSADLGWTAGGTETQWDIEYGANGFTQGSGTSITGTSSNPYSLSGLTQNTAYQFYVRADCGANGTSPWAGPFSFTTPCVANTTYPFTEGFENAGSIPSCWSQEFVSGSVNWTFTSGNQNSSVTAQTGSYLARFYSSSRGSKTSLVSPPLDLTSLTAPRLRFNYTQVEWAGDQDELRVYYRTSAGGTWTLLATYTAQVTAWTQEIITLPAASSTYYIAFEGTADFGRGVTLDNITVEETPSCLTPTNLGASTILATSASVSWTDANSTATNLYDLEYGATGFTQGSGTMVSGATTNPYSLTGLTANTTYQFYVRADCGGSGTSAWAGPFSFTTTCASETSFPYTQNFDASASTPTCWSQDAANGEDWTFGTSMTYGAASDHTSGSGRFARIDDSSPHNANPANMETVPFDLTGLTTPRLVFWYQNRRSLTSGGTSQLHIDVYNGSTWTSSVLSITTDITTWTEYTVDLTAYKSANTRVRFRAIEDPTSFRSDPSLDDITVEETPSCLTPSSPSSSNITSSSADLSWTENGTATVWFIEYGASGFTQGAGTTTTATSNPFSLGSLTADTEYDYYVRAFCAVGDTSGWAGPHTFRTACTPFTAPYSQNFDAETAPAVNSCWTVINTVNFARLATDATLLGGATPNSSPNAIEFYNYTGTNPTDQILISPQLSDLDNTKRIKFWLYDYSLSSDLIVGTITDPTNAATFTAFDTITAADMDDRVWEEFTISFASYTGSDKYVAFAHGMNTTFDYIYLDDFSYSVIPTCPEPTALNITSITNNSASVGWTEMGSATTWQVSYGTSGTSATAGTKMLSTSNPTSISGLTGNTAYDVYVRAICAPGDTSPWTGPSAFTTLCDPASAPYTESFDATSLPTCWSQSATTGGPWTFGGPGFFWNTSGCGPGPSDNTGNSGSYAAMDFSSTDVGVIMEMMDVNVSTLTVPYLQFYYWMCGTGYSPVNNLYIEAYNGSSWAPVDSIKQGTSGWESFGFDISSHIYGSGLVRIRFRAESGGSGIDYYGDMAIDDVSIFEAPNCPAPTTLGASNITATTADLNWTAGGTETSWDIEIGATGFTATGTPTSSAVSNPHSATGLTGATTYDYYVRAACGGTDGNSSWSGPYTFTTALPIPRATVCATGFASTVLSQEWDSQGTWTGDFGTGSTARRWNIRSGGTTSSNTGPSGAHSGSNYLYFETSSGTGTVGSAISPAIDLSGATGFAELSFWLHAYGATIGTLEVGVGTSASGPFTTLLTSSTEQQSDELDPWVNVGVNLDAYVGQTIYLEFKYTMGSSFTGDLAIDLVEVNTCVSCPAPSSFASSNLSNNSVDLAWTENGSATTWILEYGAQGFSTGSGTDQVVTTNPYTLTGLSPDTEYDIYIRSFCAVGDTSTYVGPISIRTRCNAFTAPYTQNWDGETAPELNSCWSTYLVGSGTGTSGPVARTTTSFTPRSASNHLELDNNSNFSNDTVAVISPQFSDMTAGDKWIRLWVKANSTFDVANLWVGTMSDPDDGTTGITILDTIDINGNTTYTQHTIQITTANGYNGSDQYIVLVHDNTDGFSEIYIDDFLYETIPTCWQPTNLSVSGISNTGAILAWTENSPTPSTSWQISAGSPGFTVGTGFDTIVSTNPLDLTGLLSSNEAFDWYVRSVCSPGDTSDWSTVSSFSTLCDAPSAITLPYFEDFEAVQDTTLEANGNLNCGTNAVWTYETSGQNNGRVRFGNDALTTNGGTGAILFDNPSGDASNFAILTIDMSNYIGATDIVMSMDIDESGDENDADDKIWIRGSSSDSWIQVYDWQLVHNSWSKTPFIDIDDALSTNTQSFSSTFQVRIGQNDDFPYSSDGMAVDNFFIGKEFSTNAFVSSNYNGQDVSCNGATDGEIVAQGLNGLSPYTFSWDANAGSSNNDTVSGLGTGQYVVTATDALGQSINDTVDVSQPTILLASITNDLNATCATATDGKLTASATGGTPPYSYSWSNGGNTATISGLATGTYTVTITDANGCVDNEQETIIVVDTIAPNVSTQNLTVYLDASGLVSITAADVDNGSSDACGISSLSLDNSTFGCADEGANTVTLTVTDVNGNQNTGSATVTVVDTVSPTALCQNVTVYLDGSGNVSITAGDIDNGSSDNCSVSSLSLDQTSFTCANEGANTVTLTVTDQAGNQSTCNATVTVVDTTSPTASCQNLTVYLDGAGNASITAGDIDNGSSDNCSVASLSLDQTSFTCANEGANTVTLTVTDQAGNQSTCTATVTVVDTVSPTPVSQNISVYLDANGVATITGADVDNGSSDNCSVASLAVSPSSFSCADEGANTVSLTVTDQAGNSSMTTATVTVIDTVAPTAICQDVTIYLDASGAASITAADVNNGSSDNCSVVNTDVDVSSFTCSDEGANTVTLTVTDQAGNQSTCTATVTVVDTISPTPSCQNLTVYLDANGDASITPADIDNGSTDNCTVASLSLDETTFDCSDLGANTVVLTVTDQAGNQSSCSATVTVMDTTAPNAVTQDLTIYLDGNGAASITANDADDGSDDNCSIVSTTITQTNFGCDDLGANTIGFTVTDQSGNSSSDTFTVTVLDTISPTISTKAHTAYLDANGDASIEVFDVSSGTSNACSIDTVFLDIYDFDCSDVGANTVTVTAQATGGSASNSATAIVTVVDTISPVVHTQSLIMYLDANGQTSINTTMVNNGSTDACGIASYSLDITTFDCSDLGNNTVVLTATDVNGNSATNTAVIEVRDTITPEPKSRDLTVYLDANGTVTVPATDVDNGSTDNCGITPSLSQSTFDCGDEGLNQEYLIITDADGNKDSTDFLITVLDTISPTVITRNITVQLGATGLASISPNQLDSASSDNCSNQLFYTATKTSFSCNDLGANTVTLTATDVHGNTTSKTATVTVEDNIAPIVQTQPVILSLDASGNASLTAAMINNGSSDNCAIDSMWISTSSFDCSNLGSNSVTLFARDASGNLNSSAVIVTVQDVVNPTAVGANATVYLDANGNGSLSAMAVDGGSTDNCGISSRSLSMSSFTCSNVGTNAVTLTVTDASANSASTGVTVTVVDTVSPTATAKAVTIALDASGNASITASDVNDGSSDACGVATLSVSPSSFTCANLGLNTVTLTVTDNNGNSSTTTAQVTVQDNRAPSVVTQNATIYLDASGNATLSTTDVDNGSSDNCAITSYSLSKTAFTCSDLGNNTVVLTVSDASGNSSNTAATVTVLDTVSPSPSTQNISVYLDASGNASISAGMIDNGSSDNCSVSSLSLDMSSFTCSNVGPNTVTLTATDGSSNTGSATAIVTVIDSVSPNARTQNITVNLDANGNASITTSDIDDGSTDACGIASYSLDLSSFTCANLGANTVNLTVTDNNGNSSTAPATVTVVDNIAPSASAQSLTVYLDASGSASITAAMVDNSSSDNCSVASLSLNQSSFGCSDLGSNTVTLTVTDGSGNSSNANATITVLDTVSPVMTTQNINLYLDANGVASIAATAVNNGSTDNCGISSYGISKSSFTCSDVGANTVILTATDGSGNSSSSSATVTVIDSISPNAVAQNITVSLDASGAASIVASNIATGSSDACGIASMSVSPSSFACTDLGANTVTLTVTDVNGNSSTATSTVTVVDNIAPTVVTQSHTVYLDASGSATIVASDINNGSTDNCTVASTSLNISSFGCSNVGQNLVTLTVTDGSGNSASGGAIVTVLDTISPTVANTPANITAYSGAGQCGTTVTWPTITGTDNCSVSTITSSISSGSFFNKGTTTVNLTATDPSGNTGGSSFTVTVLDTVAPVFTSAVSGIVISPNANSCDATVTWISPTATDNCSAVTYSSSHTSGATFSLGTTTVTVTATDADGNNRTVSFDVTVTDVIAPTISNVPANITVANDAGSCDAIVNYTLPTVSDNCTGATISASQASGSVFPLGTTTVTLTATDAAGNTTNASFDITVEDQEAPVFTTVPPSDTVGQCGQIYTFTMPSGTDNCTGLLLVRQTAGLPSGSVFPPGATTNTFEISDPAGNSSTTSFTIVVVPQGQPELPNLIEACVNDAAVNITLGQTIVWTGNGIVNNGTTFDPAVAGTGRHLLSYVFTDSMGCDAFGSIAITVLPKPVTPTITKVGSTTLQTGVYNSYQWYRDGVAIPGANLQSYTYAQSGNYQVEVSNTVGCFTYSAGFVVGSSGGGIGLAELDLRQLEVYPNPNSGKFNIELNVEGIEDLNISLFSLDGRKVYEQQAQTDHEGKVQVDVGHLPTANYFLYIRTADQVAVRKMLMK